MTPIGAHGDAPRPGTTPRELVVADVAPAGGMALYPSTLGEHWGSLAPSVRALHRGGVGARGTFELLRVGPLARLVAWVLGFPPASPSVSVTVRTERDGEHEIWLREFGGQRVRSIQYERGPLVEERYGAFAVTLRLHARDGELVFEQHDAAVYVGPWRLRLPAMLSPTIHATAAPADADDVRVSVTIIAPLLGPVLAYRGVITPGASS